MTERERLLDLLIQANIEVGGTSKVVDYLLANGVIVPPINIGDEIRDEIVCQIEYDKSLMPDGKIQIIKKIHTCDKEDVKKTIFCSHPMTWEEVEKILEEDWRKKMNDRA